MSLHSCRDWSGLPGYISMRERPLWMKRDDWESLNGRLSVGRIRASLVSRRGRWLLVKHLPLYVRGRIAQYRCLSEMLAGDSITLGVDGYHRL